MRPPVAPTGWPSEMPEPLGFRRSSVGVEIPGAEDGERLGGEGLVELDDVHVGQRQAEAAEGLLRGRHRADAHGARRHAGHGPARQPGQRPQPELLRLLGGGDDARGGAVVLPAGVAGGDGGVGVDLARGSARSFASDSTVVSARGCSSLSTTSGSDLRCGTATGDDLLGETPSVLRGDGPLVRLHGERVLVLAADVELGAQVLGGLDHAAGHGEVRAAGGDAGAGEPVGEWTRLALDAPAHVRWRRTRPGSWTRRRRRGRGRCRRTGTCMHGGDDRLQAGSAAAVHLHAGDVDAETGVEGRDPADGRGLTARGAPGRG